MPLLAVLPLLGLLSAVSGHGHVSQIDAGGVTYPGADHYNYDASSPGWLADNGDNGFVSPDAFSTADIICHKSAEASTAYAVVAAGETVKLTWNTWPDSHHGPVLDYIAPCANDDCSTVDKTALSFVKIDEAGLISGSNPGTWATDDLIADGFSWTVTIPSSLAAGRYVLRHEIIALHSAGSENGAQAYPQCINIEVTGGGSATPSGGEPATQFYTPTDPGILVSIYGALDSYDIPGPDVWQP